MSKPLSREKRLEWEEKIRKQRERSLSIDRWCRENQILPHTFYYWKERLFQKPLLSSSFTLFIKRAFPSDTHIHRCAPRDGSSAAESAYDKRSGI